MPTGLHFVRDHFPAPARGAQPWSLELAGGDRSVRLDLDALRALPARTLRVVLECAGHRRAEFDPVPSGVPWATGAVSEACWTGASLAAAVGLVGAPGNAREVVLEGADAGPVVGVPGLHRFARSLPLAKALDTDVLLAYEMNGEPIELARGGPVRAIVPGWYATDSVKWLDRVWFTAEEFGGFFQADDYRFRAPGAPAPGARMTGLPVHSLITTPGDGDAVVAASDTTIRGVAWGGTGGISDVLVRLDERPWVPANLARLRGPYARSFWHLRCPLDLGSHVLACRAIDGTGSAQPELPPANERGYANNAVHRIRVSVG